MTAKDCAAKASLSSIQPISSIPKPTDVKTLGTAFTGPMPIISAGTPATEKPKNSAFGFKLYFLSASSLAIKTAAAPSDICELLPAVTEPS